MFDDKFVSVNIQCFDVLKKEEVFTFFYLQYQMYAPSARLRKGGLRPRYSSY